METDTLFELGVNLSKGLCDEDKDIARVLAHTKDPPEFDDQTFEAKLDSPRLTLQLDRVREYMLSIFPNWKSLPEIKKQLEKLYENTHFPEQSISARLRDLRKKKFGGYVVDKKRRMTEELRNDGTWEYLVYRS